LPSKADLLYPEERESSAKLYFWIGSATVQ